MRAFRITFVLMFMLASVALAGLTYLQSHGAGISTGILLAVVLLSYLYDHGRHIAGGEKPGGSTKRSRKKGVALRQGHVIAAVQDGQAPQSGR